MDKQGNDSYLKEESLNGRLYTIKYQVIIVGYGVFIKKSTKGLSIKTAKTKEFLLILCFSIACFMIF